MNKILLIFLVILTISFLVMVIYYSTKRTPKNFNICNPKCDENHYCDVGKCHELPPDTICKGVPGKPTDCNFPICDFSKKPYTWRCGNV